MNRGLVGFLRNRIKKHTLLKALIENDELVIKEMGSDLVIDTEYLVFKFVTIEKLRIYTWYKGNKLYFYEERPRIIKTHIIDMLKEVHQERVIDVAR